MVGNNAEIKKDITIAIKYNNNWYYSNTNNKVIEEHEGAQLIHEFSEEKWTFPLDLQKRSWEKCNDCENEHLSYYINKNKKIFTAVEPFFVTPDQRFYIEAFGGSYDRPYLDEHVWIGELKRKIENPCEYQNFSEDVFYIGADGGPAGLLGCEFGELCDNMANLVEIEKGKNFIEECISKEYISDQLMGYPVFFKITCTKNTCQIHGTIGCSDIFDEIVIIFKQN
jgi:hypothetical protein